MHTEAYDALVNLKKYIREYSGELIGRIAPIEIQSRCKPWRKYVAIAR